MKTILITGSDGFVGKNLYFRLKNDSSLQLLCLTKDNYKDKLIEYVEKADFIFHLAGVNRPKNEAEFTKGNKELTEHIIDALRSNKKRTPILFTSSIQATLDNPYGKSKLSAENALLKWSKESKSPVYIYRLPGVFGKWCKPNYNSVVATFCNNIANNIPVQVSDPSHKIALVYIDEVVDEFVDRLDNNSLVGNDEFCSIRRTFEVTLSDLKDRIITLHNSRATLVMPNLEDTLNKYLYATYISYLETDKFSYELELNTDDRGWLAEFIKSKQFGQIFISKTKPGITRGNHWHNTKIEKFLVIDGNAEILFRNKINSQDIITYKATGETPTVLDIPTGYVHSITNTGTSDLITIFWASEILDKKRPDTYYEGVQ